MEGAAGDVTLLLKAYGAGDRDAFNRLVPLVYDELRRIARRQLRRSGTARSLDTVGLVNEVYLKLAAAERLHVADRTHLLAVAAAAMRQVLIGRVRARLRAKRGAGAGTVELDESVHAPAAPGAEWLLDVDRALDALWQRAPELARIFECRFFAGFSDEETAEALQLSLRTTQRGWMRARAWLRAELEATGGAGPA